MAAITAGPKASLSIPVCLVMAWSLFSSGPSAHADARAASAAEFSAVEISGQRIVVELAVTPQQRALGLMYRRHLDPDAGMLFDMGRPGRHGIWMKNTLIPLDILWLEGDGRVVDLVSDAPPCRADPCPIYSPRHGSRWILEINGGRAAELGVSRGDRVRLLGAEGESARR